MTAQLMVKETNDYYCKGCAEEQFGDLSYLVSIEEHENKKKGKKEENGQDEGDDNQKTVTDDRHLQEEEGA